jgi:ABC-2 family transporter
MDQPQITSRIENALGIVTDRGDIDRRSLERGAVVIVAALVVGLAFVWSFVGALHQPKFHKVPVAIVGPPALERALSSGSQFAVTHVDSRQAAIDRVDDKDALGGIVVGPRGIEVLVASEAGLTVSNTLKTDLPPKLKAVAPRGTPVRVIDLKPAPKNDPLGLSPFFLALSLTIGSYIGAVFFALAFGVKPVGRRVWGRLAGVAIIGVVLALGEVAIVYAIGPLHGHYVTLVLAGLLLGLSVSVMTVGLQSFLGILGTTVAILIFIILGNPASGGPVPTQLLPWIWRTLGPYLPVGAGTDLIRNIAYFGSHNLTRPLLVLFAWVAVGVVFVLASVRAHPHGLQMKDDLDRQDASRAAAAQAAHRPAA